jgi:hypothetical protein
MRSFHLHDPLPSVSSRKQIRPYQPLVVPAPVSFKELSEHPETPPSSAFQGGSVIPCPSSISLLSHFTIIIPEE